MSIVETGGVRNTNAWSVFTLIAVGLGIWWSLFSLWVAYRVGGPQATKLVDDLGLFTFQAAAAAACYVTARQSSGSFRRPWFLMAAAVTSVGVGQLTWAFYEIVLGITPGIPSPSDLGNLIALPIAVAAGLSFPSAPERTTTRGRAVVDGALVATSAFFVVWVMGLSNVYEGSGESALGRGIGIFYLVAQISVLTVLVLALRRARRSLRTRLAFVTVAMLLNVFAVSVFAYLQGIRQFGPEDRVLDAAFALVYVLFALGALWPSREVALIEEGPISPWTASIPALCLVVAALAAFTLRLMNRPLDPSPVVIGLGCALAGLLMISQFLTQRDSVGLLTASKRAEAELRDRTTLLNEVVVHAPSGLARLGRDVRIMDANPSLCTLLGAEATEFLGGAVTRFLPAQDISAAVQHLQARLDGSDTVTTESEATRVDGSKVWLRWSLTAVRKPDSSIDYYLMMFDDVDAKHKAEEAAIANLAGLERLNRLKSEFVSLVSHEFRTALTGIQGFSEMLRDEQLEGGEVKNIAQDIFNDSVRLNRMITEMLDLDRMESGRMTFRMGAVDLNQVAADAVERARATTSAHELKLDLDPNIPVIAGDADRLFQVLTNLLSNAIKYSPAGGDIVVTTRVVPAAIQVSVRDQGLGIPPEFIDKLFERYERFETKLTSAVVGTGLGLVIARRIVEGHGGRIWVDSKVGAGSEFHFTIPLQIPRTAPAEAG